MNVFVETTHNMKINLYIVAITILSRSARTAFSEAKINIFINQLNKVISSL